MVAYETLDTSDPAMDTAVVDMNNIAHPYTAPCSVGLITASWEIWVRF